MKVTRRSSLSGITRTLDLDVNPSQMEAYHKSNLPQTSFPNLTRSERIFIISGVTKEEYEEAFFERK